MNITDIIDKHEPLVWIDAEELKPNGIAFAHSEKEYASESAIPLYTRATVEKMLGEASSSQSSGGTLVRYCFECGTIGTYLPKGALACCPDNRWDYVRQEIAEQACAGFKAMLAAAPSPAKEQG